MNGHIQKWGNSLGIRIPKIVAQKLHLHSGSQVTLDTQNHSIVITKASSELDTLLNRINSMNCHHENFNDDKNVGSEVW